MTARCQGCRPRSHMTAEPTSDPSLGGGGDAAIAEIIERADTVTT